MQLVTKQLFRLTFRRQNRIISSFCTKQEDNPTEQPPKPADSEILKNTIKEVLGTIKESAVDNVTSVKEKLVKSASELKTGDESKSTLESTFSILKNAWRKTFPSQDDDARERMEQMKKKHIELQQQRQYSEDELQELQDNIPEWKRTAIQASSEAVEEKPGLSARIRQKLATGISKTEFAQNISQTEEFQEYNTFKSEMKQFKEDLKDRVQNHPSNVIQGSIYLYKSATSETDIAKAIKQMRLIDPGFDLFTLEQDAKVIFENTYLTYLRGELKNLEKVCGEVALAYFKVLLKKREAEKSVPKYQYLWNVEQATFQRAFVPDTTKLPVFVFGIKAQEIYCYVSKTDPNKIIDGDEERIMQMDYHFALTPHLNPVVEEVGHSWEIIEIQPREVVKMLV